jgi:thiamine-phosphate pyrophosphorylase
VGVSTHSEEEFERALGERPDYVALGPIFPTASKRASEPTLGLAELVRLAPRAAARSIPVVAIGGIDRERAPLVLAHADYVAVIAALLPPALPPDAASSELTRAALVDGVFERTRAYAAALCG